MDPIEKKPLYHFHPGRPILSVGSWGCNFRCDFCQNYAIAQEGPVSTEPLPPDRLAALALERNSVGVAYTYNEPLIQWEYLRDAGEAVRAEGGVNVLVTNGYVEEAPLEELLPWIDAMNVDLKAFTERFYRERCGGALEPVLRTIERAAAACHVEVTTLLIPGENDDPGELDALAAWIEEHAGAKTPLHLSAYGPRYKLQARPTSEADLRKAREIARNHLRHVYLGNVLTDDGGVTACPACGAAVVERAGYRVRTEGMRADGACAACGAACGIVT